MNPIVLIVLGILLIPVGGIGIILIIIGIVVINKEKKAIAANEDLLFDIAGVLEKEHGYKTRGTEVKRNILSAAVLLKEKSLGEIFLVAPGGKYSELRRIERTWKQDFEQACSKKFGKSPDIPVSYWPDKSLIGAWISPDTENYSEKGEFLLKFKDVFQEKLSGK